jgi:glucose-1-phosphate cytidylyltransferase
MVRPSYTFHTVEIDDDGVVQDVKDVERSDIWVNGGYFVLNRAIFDRMEPGEELVTDVFAKLVADRRLTAYRHKGFWAPMDTLKEQQELEAMIEAGGGPWRLWERGLRENGAP